MTATDRQRVISKVKELSCLRESYPFEEEGRLALAVAFIDSFPGYQAVSDAVEDILRTEGAPCPRPSDVWALARAKGYQQSSQDRLRKIATEQLYCEACSNTGWRQVEAYQTGLNDEGQQIRVPIDAVVRCICPLGKAMAKAS